MKRIYILNGPNLSMLGIREPDLYGKQSYKELKRLVKAHAKDRRIKPVFFQSNCEGALVSKIHEAYFKGALGIVINPGAYTHTSIALLDAVKATMLPTVEVHISNVGEREDFRQVSYVGLAAKKTIAGLGLRGYTEAIDFLLEESTDEGKN